MLKGMVKYRNIELSVPADDRRVGVIDQFFQKVAGPAQGFLGQLAFGDIYENRRELSREGL